MEQQIEVVAVLVAQPGKEADVEAVMQAKQRWKRGALGWGLALGIALPAGTAPAESFTGVGSTFQMSRQ